MTYNKIDSITWNDLNMDEVYNRINLASSSVGSEYLLQVLHELETDENILINRNLKTTYFEQNPDMAQKLKKIYKKLGKTKKYTFIDYIFKLNEIKPQSNLKHIILIVLLIVAIALIFIKPVIGIIALVVMIAVNIMLYFNFRSKIEAYFNCIKYLVSMVVTADKILKEKLPKEFSDDKEELKSAVKTFASERRGSWLITNSVAGSIVDVILDYVRMIFHIDLIKFNCMQKHVVSHQDDILSLYNVLGEIEVSMCIAEYRKDKVYCLPEFVKDSNKNTSCSNNLENQSKSVDIRLSFKDIAHPLVKVPVTNSLDVKGPILLTGSNASGKSTFLKSIAINQIFAQTIYTVFASEYKTTFFKVFSSMALADNLLKKESYFIVEIKSLKRIFDACNEDEDMPVLCFIDEVLRGTNTKERIAASSQILKKLASKNALVFAATHDIELTSLLEGDMLNYHFSERIEGDNVLFDYKLKEGPSDTSNAIKLLKSFGFDQDIVEKAENMIHI